VGDSCRPRCGATERDVRDARSGSDAAFERLYVELRPRVRSTAYKVVRDEHEAEDTTQDVFLAAYRRLPTLVDPEAFEGWLMKIAKNRAVDRRRGMLKCRPAERVHDDAADCSPELPRVVHRSGVAEPSPDTMASFRGEIEDMSASMRDALRLRYMKGLSCEEIARRKGLSVGAVKTRLFRARRRLRAALSLGEPRTARSRSPEKTCVSEPAD
jgi:RNA polymerase sigma-70 factor (ECF subfamily)